MLRANRSSLRASSKHTSTARSALCRYSGQLNTTKDCMAKRPLGSRFSESARRAGSCPVNRMKAALVRLGIRGFNPKLRKAPERLATLRTPEGYPIPPNTLAELTREMAHLRFINDQIKQIEDERLQQLKH